MIFANSIRNLLICYLIYPLRLYAKSVSLTLYTYEIFFDPVHDI
jgi:hypothetical protein